MLCAGYEEGRIDSCQVRCNSTEFMNSYAYYRILNALLCDKQLPWLLRQIVRVPPELLSLCQAFSLNQKVPHSVMRELGSATVLSDSTKILFCRRSRNLVLLFLQHTCIIARMKCPTWLFFIVMITPFLLTTLSNKCAVQRKILPLRIVLAQCHLQLASVAREGGAGFCTPWQLDAK